jgi:hypothetical protein
VVGIHLDAFTVRVVANFFLLIVIPAIAVGAYLLGYSDGKIQGWISGFLGDDGP